MWINHIELNDSTYIEYIKLYSKHFNFTSSYFVQNKKL